MTAKEKSKESEKTENENDLKNSELQGQVPPDGGYGWVVLVASFVSTLKK